MDSDFLFRPSKKFELISVTFLAKMGPKIRVHLGLVYILVFGPSFAQCTWTQNHPKKSCRVQARTRPEFQFRSGSGSGGIRAGTGSGLVPVDLPGTRPELRFFSECDFKVAKKTVENRYRIV